PCASAGSSRGSASSSLRRSDGVDDDVDGSGSRAGHPLEVLEHAALDVPADLGNRGTPVDVDVQLDRDAFALRGYSNAAVTVALARNEAADTLTLASDVRCIAGENLARNARLTLHST